MPAAQRCFAPGVIDQLLTHPHRFEFFQAVRLIELWLRQNGVEDGPIPMQYLRFENSLSLSFPPSQIAALAAVADVPVDSAATLQRAALEKRLRHIAITPAFIGLLCGNGGLPNHDVMRIADYEFTTKDTGPRAFLDMLSTRSVGLFYQAWARHRPQCMGDAAGHDQFLTMLLALSGLRRPAGRITSASSASLDAEAASDEAGLGDEVLAYHAAQFRSRCVPASVIAGVLTEYFGVPFALEQLVGRWEELPSRYRPRLGGANCTLGAGVTLGRRIHRRDSHARLRVGPLKYVRQFHETLGLHCHPNTYAHYGSDRNEHSFGSVHWQTSDYVHGELFITRDDDVFGQKFFRLEMYHWVDGILFSFAGGPYDEDHIGRAAQGIETNIVARLRHRARDEIPTEPGFCIKDGFIADDGRSYQGEEARMQINLQEWPDVWISFYSQTVPKGGGQTLLQRVASHPFTGIYAILAKQIKTFRRGEHDVNGFNYYARRQRFRQSFLSARNVPLG